MLAERRPADEAIRDEVVRCRFPIGRFKARPIVTVLAFVDCLIGLPFLEIAGDEGRGMSDGFTLCGDLGGVCTMTHVLSWTAFDFLLTRNSSGSNLEDIEVGMSNHS